MRPRVALLSTPHAFGYVNTLNISEYSSKVDSKHPSECGVDYNRTYS